jgi:prophage regulatory protein
MGMHDMTARIITRDQLNELVPYSPGHIARLEQAGKFPRRLKLGPNSVGWLSNEIEKWIEDCAAARHDQ